MRLINKRKLSQLLHINPDHHDENKVQIYYFTDPVCSHCFVMEPVIMKLLLEYGHVIDYTVVMGGMLETWEGFMDPKNGINQAGDVYRHWREVGEQSGMPINGSLWLRDPIISSYPASRMFNVAETMYPDKKYELLRRIREAAFVFDENISRPEVLEHIAEELGFDAKELLRRAAGEEGNELFEKDLHTTAVFNVRGFPTIYIGRADEVEAIVGSTTYEVLQDAVLRYLPEAEKKPIPPLMDLLQEHKRLYYREIELLYNVQSKDLDNFIKEYTDSRARQVEFYDGYYLEYEA